MRLNAKWPSMSLSVNACYIWTERPFICGRCNGGTISDVWSRTIFVTLLAELSDTSASHTIAMFNGINLFVFESFIYYFCCIEKWSVIHYNTQPIHKKTYYTVVKCFCFWYVCFCFNFFPLLFVFICLAVSATCWRWGHESPFKAISMSGFYSSIDLNCVCAMWSDVVLVKMGYYVWSYVFVVRAFPWKCTICLPLNL